MKTSSRRQPIEARSLTSRPPARPTNGRPSRSSLKPGPSPTNTTSVSGFPSPGTDLASASRAGGSWCRPAPRTRSPRVPSGARRRSRRGLDGSGAAYARAPRLAAGRTQPRSRSTSASSTAFVAAPFRRLSETTQNASPRPSRSRRRSCTRPTKISSRPVASVASGYSCVAGSSWTTTPGRRRTACAPARA